jgi:hypothetical protein
MGWWNSFQNAMSAIKKNGPGLAGDILANLPAAASGRAGLLGGPLLAIGGGIGDYLLQGQKGQQDAAFRDNLKAEIAKNTTLSPGQKMMATTLVDAGQYDKIAEALKQPPQTLSKVNFKGGGQGYAPQAAGPLPTGETFYEKPSAAKPSGSATDIQAARELGLSTDPSQWTAPQARAISAQVAQNKLMGAAAPLPEIMPATEGGVSGYETIPRSRSGAAGKPTFTPFGAGVTAGRPRAPESPEERSDRLRSQALAEYRALPTTDIANDDGSITRTRVLDGKPISPDEFVKRYVETNTPGTPSAPSALAKLMTPPSASRTPAAPAAATITIPGVGVGTRIGSTPDGRPLYRFPDGREVAPKRGAATGS